MASVSTVVIIFVCLAINALFSAIEIAFVSVSKPTLRERVRKGDKDAVLLLRLRDNPERTLSILQTGITLFSGLAAAVGGAGAQESVAPYLQDILHTTPKIAELTSMVAVVIPLTFFNVVVGELVPKSIALRHSLGLARYSARWIMVFDRSMRPLVNMLEGSTRLILKLILRKGTQKSTGAEEPGPSPFSVDIEHLTQQHRQYVMNLVNIEKKKIRDLSVEWKTVMFIKTTDSEDDIEKIILNSGHTRLPVVAREKIIGLINTKEFLNLKSNPGAQWETIIRPVVHLPDTTPIIGALRIMQARRSHMGVVIQGTQVLGIITLEDILEEVVGDIYDEDDDGLVKHLLASSKKRG